MLGLSTKQMIGVAIIAVVSVALVRRSPLAQYF
jgi:hypothetical protein